MRRVWFTAWLLLTACAAQAAVVVRTTAGETIRGTQSSVSAEGFVIQTGDGAPVVVTAANLIEWSRTDPPVAEGSGTAVAAPVATPREPGTGAWETLAIGTVVPGTATEEGGGTWAVRGGGRGIQGSSDSAFLVHQPLESSGQLVSRLDAFDGAAAEAMAGIMLRDNVGEAAAYAFVGRRAGSGLCFQYRQIASGMTMRVTNVTQALPAWLRLSRVGGSVVAEISADGREWQPLGKANVNLGQSVRAGMVVSAGADEVAVSARFTGPSVGARGMGYVAASGYPRLLFRNGSLLVAPVESADESVVRLGGAWSGTLVSVVNLARIEFVPLNPDLESRLDPERRGVMLVEGDYFDGTLRSMATNAVTMNSLLFGFRKFSVGSEAGLVQVGAVEAEEDGYTVVLANGSEIRARHLETGDGWVRAEAPLLGALVLKADLLRQVRRSGAGR